MHIQLSDHFTYGRLIRFVIPSIITMIFTSVYGMVDGFFVSNLVGKTPFAALNLIMPFLMLFGCLGFMFGTGGSALVARTLGEGDAKRANEIFSLLVVTALLVGTAVSLIGLVFLRPVAMMLGAEGELLRCCLIYGRILLIGTPPFILQYLFQSFLITAERPGLGLYVTVAAGVTNIVLDALFIAVFDWGLAGAALATAGSQFMGGLLPLVYFLLPNKSLLRLVRPRFDWRALFQTCTNGSSEMVTNLSMSLVGMLYNLQLMRFAGENGVAAYGVIMYVNFIFVGIFVGFSVGSAPIVSYHFGAGNTDELRNLRRKSILFMLLSGIVLTAAAVALARPLSMIFVSYDQTLLDMTVRGFILYSLAFLFMGFNIFGSNFFTALNNGLVSAVISFMRTLVIQVIVILILPEFLALDGVWLSIVAAEFGALLITAFFLVKMRKKYRY
ncbi:MAG: MATE family efflux transporter [Butyricicoccus sp.]|nr:MATE family efflux transporter [Butyricicoccus sp.]